MYVLKLFNKRGGSPYRKWSGEMEHGNHDYLLRVAWWKADFTHVAHWHIIDVRTGKVVRWWTRGL